MLLPQLINRLEERYYEPRSTSYSGLSPGDLIQFSFMGQLRHGFVISSRRTTNGLFMSTRNKSLANVMVTDTLSDAAFNFLLNNIYDDENKADYHYLKSIGFAGTYSHFRTIPLLGIRQIVKIHDLDLG